MRKTKTLPILVLLCICCGCVSAPFKRPGYVALDRVDPSLALSEFSQTLAERMDLITSIVFQYKWRSFAALGFSRVDRTEGKFQVSCMNPVGIKLFELSGDREKVTPVFVLKELLQRGDLPQAVGQDIRRIYFDMLPGPGDSVKKQKYKIVFFQGSPKNGTKYVFSGYPARLTEKHHIENKRILWSVYYYGYKEQNGKLYPADIILKHRRFGYNLVIRLKEVVK